MIGAVLTYARLTTAVNPPVIPLAIEAAASLILVEIVCVVKSVISPIYLGDALVELVLIAWWVISLLIA